MSIGLSFRLWVAPVRAGVTVTTGLPREPTPARVSPQQLNVIREIHSVDAVGHLVLMFGPNAGETLGLVAQNDLEYLQQLARTAQPADVRVAAARLIAAVLSDPPCIEERRASDRGVDASGAVVLVL